MPIVGRSRKAKPRHIYDAHKAETFRRPTATESFARYGELLEGTHDHVLELLMKLGYGEPCQREYLYRLECLAGEIHSLRHALHCKWKEH